MAWLQITLETDSAHAADLAELLSEVGADAVTLQDAAHEPLYEPPLGTTPLWSCTYVTGLFDAATDRDTMLESLQKALGAAALPPYRIEIIEDQDWERVCLAGFQPLRFGERLWICPSWHIPPDPQAVNILLDPGLAFGTGTHPTTALCLEWLAGATVEGLQIIDYGCGSGILGIAAALLGAKQVYAVDNDPQALVATQDNATKNAVAERIHISLPEQFPQAPVDLLLANILARPLMDYAEYFATLVRPGGRIILSGILTEQSADLLQAYEDSFVMQPVVERDGWVRLEGLRKSDKV